METHDYKDFTIVLEQDMDAINPYDTGNYYFCLRHKRYNLPHDLPYGFVGDDTAESLRAYFRAHGYTYLPVYMLDHGDITLSTTPFANCWDSGLLGFIYYEPGMEPEGDAKEYLKEEVAVYNQWMDGDVYIVSIHKGGTEYDHLGNLFGREYSIGKAKEIIDSFPPDDMNRNI